MTHKNPHALRFANAAGWCCAVFLLLPWLLGCFDSQSMIEARRKVAVLARLEEIDLGTFRLTLPTPIQSNEMTEIEFHAFGHVANRDLDKVAHSLEEHGAELRHRLLLATRQLSLQDLEQAQLDLLRNEIAAVINQTLEGEPLQSVGFYKFHYYNF